MDQIHIKPAQLVEKILYEILYFLSFNLLLIVATGVFAYRTFVLGRFNLALLILVVALFLINNCRWIVRYSEDVAITLIYRLLVLASVGMLLASLCIQTIRFIYVFVPTMTEFTLPKILVRIGVTTTIFYVYALIASFIYYLYVNDMISAVWQGSLERFLARSVLTDKDHRNWRQGRFASLAFIYTFFWGGLASISTLTIGLIGWLFR